MFKLPAIRWRFRFDLHRITFLCLPSWSIAPWRLPFGIWTTWSRSILTTGRSWQHSKGRTRLEGAERADLAGRCLRHSWCFTFPRNESWRQKQQQFMKSSRVQVLLEELRRSVWSGRLFVSLIAGVNTVSLSFARGKPWRYEIVENIIHVACAHRFCRDTIWRPYYYLRLCLQLTALEQAVTEMVKKRAVGANPS